MSNVEMFKYYASKLNLSKPQLEAVTDCFKACFEADGRNVSEPNDDKEIYETDPSEDRTQDASFNDNTMWGSRDMDRVLNKKGASARLANAMKAAPVARMNSKDQEDIMNDGMDVVNGNFHLVADKEEKRQADIAAKRQKVMNLQRKLNKELGINLAVDGIKGPQTIAAEKRYNAMLAGNRQYAANQSNETANAARVKYAGAPVQRSEDTTWQKQSPHNGMRYYGDAYRTGKGPQPKGNEWGQANTSGTPTRPAQPSTGDAAGEQKEGLAQKAWEFNQKYNPVSPRHLKEAWNWWTK